MLRLQVLGVTLAVLFSANVSQAKNQWGSFYGAALYKEIRYQTQNPDAKDEELVRKLRLDISRTHKVLSYDDAREFLLGQLHLEENKGSYYIHDVYCQKDFTKSDFGSKAGIGPNKIPDGGILNTEHTWPQSRFTGMYPRHMQKTDLHHLYPSDSKMNSIRGNNKFGEVDNPAFDVPCETSAIGRAPNGGFRFEPPDVHKGNVARALFYFSVRYNIQIDADEEKYLRAWHVADPADADEKARNDGIQKVQGNRNPFIDMPQLVDQIGNF